MEHLSKQMISNGTLFLPLAPTAINSPNFQTLNLPTSILMLDGLEVQFPKIHNELRKG
jgi:hypothetical protein